MIRISNPDALKAIIDYCNFPFSYNANECFFHKEEIFFTYGHGENYCEVRGRASVDVNFDYWGITINLWTPERPISHLALTSKGAKVRCYYNRRGRIEHENYQLDND